jgi:hypothetical protein
VLRRRPSGRRQAAHERAKVDVTEHHLGDSPSPNELDRDRKPSKDLNVIETWPETLPDLAGPHH